MFGGAGLYADELMFALGVDDTLYLKADAETRPLFEAAGSDPFTYARRDGTATLTSYWRLPDAALDDPEEAVRWGRVALDAARRAALRKKPARRKG
jgi:DNA transformation protein